MTPDESGRLERRGNEIMDSRHAAAVECFIKHLKLLRLEAGNPSLGRLEELSNRKALKSTLDDHLSGRRARLPTWQLVAAYVSACHRAAASTGIEVRNLGSLQDWHARYRAALEGDLEASCPVQAQPREVSRTAAKEEVSREQPDATVMRELPESARCARCRAVHDRDVRFCPNCGAPMPGQDSHADETKVSTFGLGPTMPYYEAEQLARSLSSGSAILFAERIGATEKHFILDKDVTTIGRDTPNDIPVKDPSVSRRHSIIYRRGKQFAIKDMGSLNGTFVNQQRTDDKPIESGDVVHIGAVRFVFFQSSLPNDL